MGAPSASGLGGKSGLDSGMEDDSAPPVRGGDGVIRSGGDGITSPSESQHSRSLSACATTPGPGPSPSSGWSHSGYTAGGGAGGGGPSAADTEADDGLQTGSKKRKTETKTRESRPRWVSNLTPEQLAKKRANDREAQRAIRERQRLRNERYEREIRDLKAQQPYQELQAALQRTSAVESELDHVKSVLASVVNLIQPIINRPAVTRSPPLQQALQQQEQHQQVHPQQAPNIGSTPSSAASPGSVGTQGRCSFSEQVHTVPAATNEHSGQDHGQLLIGPIAQQRHLLIHGLDLGPERLGLDIVLDPTRITRMDAHSAQDTSQYRHIPMKHDWTATSVLPGAIPTDHTGNNSGASSNQSPPPPHAPPPFMAIPISQTDIKNCAPTCPLDSLLQDFLAERRQRFSEGLPAQEILGPRYPSVSSLLNPSHAAFSHPLSKVFTDIIARFPELCGIPERIAVLYSMFLLMRWQVSPTPENYTRVPEWLRPRPEQLSIPHPTWIDHLPFPAMRERLVSRGWYPFENFTIPFTTTLSVNWPYEDVDALLRSPVGDELMINPVFERHVCRLENWTLGDAFDDAYPGLRGTYGFRSERQGGVIKPAECQSEGREGEGWGGSF